MGNSCGYHTLSMVNQLIGKIYQLVTLQLTLPELLNHNTISKRLSILVNVN